MSPLLMMTVRPLCPSPLPEVLVTTWAAAVEPAEMKARPPLPNGPLVETSMLQQPVRELPATTATEPPWDGPRAVMLPEKTLADGDWPTRTTLPPEPINVG